MAASVDVVAARNAGHIVRVTLDDGRVLTGVPQRTLTGYMSIHHDGASRPAYFLPEDVALVEPVV